MQNLIAFIVYQEISPASEPNIFSAFVPALLGKSKLIEWIATGTKNVLYQIKYINQDMPKKKFPFTGFSSLAIHAGHTKDPLYAHLTPIYASSTFVFDSAEQGMRRFNGEENGYIYSRWGNPTFTEAEEKIAAMESFGVLDKNGNTLQPEAILHSSGMAAISTLMLMNLKSGDKILSHFSLYGGTDEILHKILPTLGIVP